VSNKEKLAVKVKTAKAKRSSAVESLALKKSGIVSYFFTANAKSLPLSSKYFL
jgi:hypothetical protein